MTNITVEIDKPTHPPGVFRIRKWVIEQDGMDTATLGYGSFGEVPLFTEKGGFGATVQFQRIGVWGEQYLRAIQPKDDIYFYKKWNWLVNQTGNYVRPYWYDENMVLRFGTLVFAGQLVKVKIDDNGQPIVRVVQGKYRAEPAGINHPIEFYILDGATRVLLDSGITHQSHPWYIQKATQFNRQPAENTYSELTQGTIYHPVWSPVDFPCNNGAELLVARAFLEV